MAWKWSLPWTRNLSCLRYSLLLRCFAERAGDASQDDRVIKMNACGGVLAGQEESECGAEAKRTGKHGMYCAAMSSVMSLMAKSL